MVKLRWILILIVLLVSYVIISANDLSLKEKQDQKEFASIFSKWINKVIRNVGTIMGQVIKQEWSPINDSKGKNNDTKTTN